MTTVLALGAGVGLGCWLVVRALWPRPEPLARALARLDRVGPPSPWSLPPSVARQPPHVRVGERVAARLHGRSLGVAPDVLAAAGRTPEQHVAEKLLAVVAAVALPTALALVLAAGGVRADPAVVAVATLALVPAAWFLPDLTARSSAQRRRAELRHALSGYLDLVDVLLAGGAGTETALVAAAEAGDGWAFAELRAALVRARALRRSPWESFGELGRRLGVAELVELAASVRLAGEHGARIRASLSAKAASLRGHELARVEADAQAASERMALPAVLMFTGFLVFVGYPAVAEILGGGL